MAAKPKPEKPETDAESLRKVYDQVQEDFARSRARLTELLVQLDTAIADDEWIAADWTATTLIEQFRVTGRHCAQLATLTKRKTVDDEAF